MLQKIWFSPPSLHQPSSISFFFKMVSTLKLQGDDKLTPRAEAIAATSFSFVLPTFFCKYKHTACWNSFSSIWVVIAVADWADAWIFSVLLARHWVHRLSPFTGVTFFIWLAIIKMRNIRILYKAPIQMKGKFLKIRFYSTMYVLFLVFNY